MTYFNFDLLIEEGRRGYRARLLESPAGEAWHDFVLEGLLFEPLLFEEGSPADIEEARRVGEGLFGLVFVDTVLSAFRRSLDLVQKQGVGLRIRLRLAEVPLLASLGWEYLYDATARSFLSLSQRTPIVRYLDLPLQVRALQALKILVMLSTPPSYASLDVEGEWLKLQQALDGLQREGVVVLERLEAATLPALQRRLRTGEFHLLHFVGHGLFDQYNDKGILILEREEGAADDFWGGRG